jgi:hypothetical protein
MGVVKERANLAPQYDEDFAAWAFHQADAVKRRDWAALDVPHLVEELESMGKQQRAELVSRLLVMLQHLAKLDAQPDAKRHHRSWRLSVLEQRLQVQTLLQDNPSLKPFIDEAMQRAWQAARLAAARETRLSTKRFPQECPMTFKDAMTRPMGE